MPDHPLGTRVGRAEHTIKSAWRPPRSAAASEAGQLPAVAGSILRLQHTIGNVATREVIASSQRATMLIQRDPSRFKDLVPKDLVPGFFQSLSKDPWNNVVSATNSYAGTPDRDIELRASRLDTLEDAITQWRRVFDEKFTVKGTTPARTMTEMEGRQLEFVAKLGQIIREERADMVKARTKDKKSGSGEDVTCYRGMSFTHPRFAEARQGIIRPMTTTNKGANFDTENTSFTAFDTAPTQPAAIATGSPLIWGVDHLKNGKLVYDPSEPVGLVLEITVKESNIAKLNKGEVQIEGEIVSDKVHTFLPDSDIAAFQLGLKNVPGEKGASFADAARENLEKRKTLSEKELLEARNREMIRYRVSSIYEEDQKKAMIAKLEKEYGIKY